jgi:hypothetical protein
MEHERIEVTVKSLRQEVDVLVGIVANYYVRLSQAGVPTTLAERLVQDLHNWMLSHYRLTNPAE